MISISSRDQLSRTLRQQIAQSSGAEIVSRPEDVRRGAVCVGAPIRQRLALAALTLRACRLPGISSDLASRLSGTWASTLSLRGRLSSLADGLLALGSRAAKTLSSLLEGGAIAGELQLLAVSAPWTPASSCAHNSKRGPADLQTSNLATAVLLAEGCLRERGQSTHCFACQDFHEPLLYFAPAVNTTPPVGLEPTIFGLEVRRLVH